MKNGSEKIVFYDIISSLPLAWPLDFDINYPRLLGIVMDNKIEYMERILYSITELQRIQLARVKNALHESPVICCLLYNLTASFK